MTPQSPSQPPPQPVLPAGAPLTLSPQQLAELDQARKRLRKIRRSATWAVIDGWSLAIFGGITLALQALGLSFAGLVVGAGLLAIGVLETRFARQLRELDPLAGRRLGWNQIALMALLIGYALYAILSTLTGPSSLDEISAQYPELADMLAGYADLMRVLVLAVYGGVILVAVLVPGLSALVYFRRERHVRDYIAQTPPWLVALQQQGVML